MQTLLVLLSLCSSFHCTQGATQGDIASAVAQLPDLVPFISRALGENCITPLDGDGKAQAEYDVQEHPLNPAALMVQVTIVMEWDCGLAGHWNAHGIDAHEGDRESFYMTLVKADCGWRVHAIKTINHHGNFYRREINERIVEGTDCARPDDVVMSLGKHALYVSWMDCSKRTPAEICLGDPRDALQYTLQRARRTFTAGTCPDGELRLPNPGNQENEGGCIFGADENAALCYKKCCYGYEGAMTMCIPPCPSGFRDDGLYCAKPAAYGRGTGYPWRFGDGFNLDAARARCEKDHPHGCEQWGAIIYPMCKDGFYAFGCCVCSPRCPNTMVDIGVSCQKNTYDRGVGVLP